MRRSTQPFRVEVSPDLLGLLGGVSRRELLQCFQALDCGSLCRVLVWRLRLKCRVSLFSGFLLLAPVFASFLVLSLIQGLIWVQRWFSEQTVEIDFSAFSAKSVQMFKKY